MQVFLIDGTYELFRMYFGAPSARVQGQEVGAARALLRSLGAMVRRAEVTHIAAAFDTVIESFRNELFDGYKTGAGIEPDLLSQFPLVEEVAEALGITVFRMHEFEADDAIASAAAIAAADDRVEKVWMCSPDKDLAQCVVGERVVCFDRRKQQEMGHQGVVAKFGIEPASIPDYLALVGDTADGIPGIPRWGAKSTATVLARYRHLDKIPDDVEHWEVSVRGAKALAKNLASERDNAELYRTLATLRRDAVDTPVDALRWSGPDEEKLAEMREKLGL